MPTQLEKACQYLITRSYPSYNKDTCGKCASKVADAWDFAFGRKVKRFKYGKDCGATYEDLGFKKIFSFVCYPKIRDILNKKKKTTSQNWAMLLSFNP